jgi:hypothetical protein
MWSAYPPEFPPKSGVANLFHLSNSEMCVHRIPHLEGQFRKIKINNTPLIVKMAQSFGGQELLGPAVIIGILTLRQDEAPV